PDLVPILTVREVQGVFRPRPVVEGPAPDDPHPLVSVLPQERRPPQTFGFRWAFAPDIRDRDEGLGSPGIGSRRQRRHEQRATAISVPVGRDDDREAPCVVEPPRLVRWLPRGG